MITQGQLRRARLRVKLRERFKPFAMEVKQATGLALKMPEHLIDSTTDEEVKIMFEVLNDLGIKQNGNFWEAR